MSKMKKKYYLKLKDMVDHQVLLPANIFRYIQTVDGRFSDSSGVLMKYFIHMFFTSSYYIGLVFSRQAKWVITQY